MQILMVYPETPTTYWSFHHALLIFTIELTVDCVTRATCSGSIWAATLYYEIRNNSVKGKSIVESLFS